MIQIRPMLAADAVLLELQPSQHFEAGLYEPILTIERGRDLAENGIAWTVHEGSKILGCGGFRRIFEGHFVAWAAFSGDVPGGQGGITITRHAQRMVKQYPFRRLEAIVEKDNMRAIEWCIRIGLEPVHILLNYGEDAKTHVLFERLK